MGSFKKYFSPQEVREQLPLIKTIVADILIRGRQMRAILASHEGGPTPIAARRIGEEIETLILELEAIGCFYKDFNFEIGLVDFPTIIEDKEVFLCWKSDELDIGWFHPIDEGFAGRRPLPINWLVA